MVREVEGKLRENEENKGSKELPKRTVNSPKEHEANVRAGNELGQSGAR